MTDKELINKEPVTNIDFEQELYKAFGQVKDFTLGLQIAKKFYEMGKHHQEPMSEDLEKEINKYFNALYSGWTSEEREKDSLVEEMCKKTARHFAKWEEERVNRSILDKMNQIKDKQIYSDYDIEIEDFVNGDLEKVASKYSDELKSSYTNGMFDRSNIFNAFIAGIQRQKAYDNIPQELVEAYWEFTKVCGENLRDFINAVNGYTINKEAVSEGLENAAIKYAQDKYMPVQTSQAFKSGAQWQKQEMMKRALDGKMVVGDEAQLVIPSLSIITRMLDDGDKVKVIIIKEN